MNPFLVPEEVDGIAIAPGEIRYLVGPFVVAARDVDVRGWGRPRAIELTVQAAVPGVVLDNIKQIAIRDDRPRYVREFIRSAFRNAAVCLDIQSHRPCGSAPLVVGVNFASLPHGELVAWWTVTIGTLVQTTEMRMPSGPIDEHVAEILRRAASQYPGLGIDLVTDDDAIVAAIQGQRAMSPRAAALLRDLEARTGITVAARLGSSARSEAES